MKAIEVVRRVQEVSADQWGLFTTAQAKQQGIIGTELSRAAQAGQIEPITHGVYRLAGVPSDEFDGIRAAWLSTDPKRPAYERLNDEDPVVVSGSSAAWLHGIGDLQPEPYQFSSPARRQTRRPDVRFRRRNVPPEFRTVSQGLPVTTVEQTIADLVHAKTDLSLISNCLVDATQRPGFDIDTLANALDPQHHDRGVEERDQLLRHAGLDSESVIRKLQDSPIGVEIAARAIRPLMDDLKRRDLLTKIDHSWVNQNLLRNVELPKGLMPEFDVPLPPIAPLDRHERQK